MKNVILIIFLVGLLIGCTGGGSSSNNPKNNVLQGTLFSYGGSNTLVSGLHNSPSRLQSINLGSKKFQYTMSESIIYYSFDSGATNSQIDISNYLVSGHYVLPSVASDLTGNIYLILSSYLKKDSDKLLKCDVITNICSELDAPTGSNINTDIFSIANDENGNLYLTERVVTYSSSSFTVNGYIFKSSDSANTWQNINYNLSSDSSGKSIGYFDIAADTSNNVYVLDRDTNNTFYKLSSLSNNWSNYAYIQNNVILKFVVNNQSTIYALDSNSLAFSNGESGMKTISSIFHVFQNDQWQDVPYEITLPCEKDVSCQAIDLNFDDNNNLYVTVVRSLYSFDVTHYPPITAIIESTELSHW